MAERPDPVTELDWDPSRARELGEEVVELWAELLTDLIASALNQNLGGFRLSPGANQVEHAVIRWLARSFGLPDGAGGQVVAGGAMANFRGAQGGARSCPGPGRPR